MGECRRRRVLEWLVAGIAAAVGGAGCSPTFRGRAIQPNPSAAPTEVLRTSEAIDIVTGDMELNVPRPPTPGMPASIIHYDRFKLHNLAWFTLVSRDRIRFHVQIEHKWKEYADLGTWHAVLEDDQGHVYLPEGLDRATTKLLVTMWDVETRSVQRNQFGDIMAINDDGWKRRQPLGSLAVFRGRGDFVFYKRDILPPDVKWLKLVVSRPGEAFEFTWDFADAGGPEDR